MPKPCILFVCTGNSARSQMAEGFARYYGGDSLEVESAGTQPAGLNESAVWAMREAGIDISRQSSDALSDKDLKRFDYIITLCGDARDTCPPLPATARCEHWGLPDPARVRGTPEDVIQAFRVVRYQVEHRVRDLLGRIQGG